MLRIVRAVARVQAARPCVAAVRAAHAVALPARLAGVAARPLAAARPSVAAAQWGSFRSSALAASEDDAPARDAERTNQVRRGGCCMLHVALGWLRCARQRADARSATALRRSSSAATCRSAWTARS